MNAATTEVQKLRKIAAERYHLDGGVMFECTTSDGYHDLIKTHGTAEAAWTAELMLADIRSESFQY